MTLRVSRIDGAVTLTMPDRVAERDAQRFLADKAEWIEKARAGVAAPSAVAVGSTIPVRGSDLLLRAAPVRAPRREDAALLVPASGTAGAVRAWLRREARLDIDRAVERHASALGRRPGRITLRDTRSRWGSCTSDGNLMLSWRLIMAPDHVLDYVVAHEMAHLVEMNHSRAFWDIVSRLRPDFRLSKGWLRGQGGALHRYRFD